MRKTGQILIALAVVGAVIGGLILPSRVNEGLGSAAPLIGLLFLLVTGTAAAGIYFYVKSEREDAGSLTETELQRRISDALGTSDRLSFSALAGALNADADSVARLVSELARLEVLPAAVSWESAIIYPKNRGYLAWQTVCLHCGAEITPQPKSVVCPVCRTIHYDI